MPQNAAKTNTIRKTKDGMIAGPHKASQMAQPAYHHSPLTKSARSKHKTNPQTTKPNLTAPDQIPEWRKQPNEEM